MHTPFHPDLHKRDHHNPAPRPAKTIPRGDGYRHRTPPVDANGDPPRMGYVTPEPIFRRALGRGLIRLGEWLAQSPVH
jgi:hypothetical protein